MRKIIMELLIIALMLTLVSCSGNVGDTDTSSLPTDSQITVSDDDDTGNEPTNSNGSGVILGEFDRSATISETVLVDENDIFIKATGLTFNNYAVELELLIENNSQKDLSFICESIGYSRNSVNGYMIEDGYLSSDVSAGKKANEIISFNYDNLMIYGIMEIADIEVGFDIKDMDYNQVLLTGPRQVKTSLADSYDYNTDYYKTAIVSDALINTYNYSVLFFDDDERYNQNDVSVISECIIVNQDGEPTLLLEIYNGSGDFVYLVTDDIAINGLLVNSYTWSTEAINPNKYGIVNIELSSVLNRNYWDVYGIKDVGKVSVSLEQKDEEYNSISTPTQISVTVPNAEASFDKLGEEIYNNNGVRIVSKIIVSDDSGYSNDMYVLLYAENNTGKTISIDDVYDSLSINGYMTDYSFSSIEIPNGDFGLIEIKLWESSLEKNNISTVADITTMEFGVEIKEGYDSIDEPNLTINY